MVTSAEARVPFKFPYDEWLELPVPNAGSHQALLEGLRETADRVFGAECGSPTVADGAIITELLHGVQVHALKEFARKRGWPAHDHAVYQPMANYIGERIGNDEIGALFSHVAHSNFYDDTMDRADIEKEIARTDKFLAAMAQAEADPRLKDAPPPPKGTSFYEIAAGEGGPGKRLGYLRRRRQFSAPK